MSLCIVAERGRDVKHVLCYPEAMKTPTMNPPEIVSRAEWQAAHEKLLAKEKEATHARDALAAERAAVCVVAPARRVRHVDIPIRLP
jgi:hypothetical protein